MITSFVSIKGGVGKTTTCISLAAALTEVGQHVLVVDLDSQASASLSLGLGRRDLAPSAADVLLRNLKAVKAIRPAPTGGVDVLPGSADLLSVEGDLAFRNDKEKVLGRALAPVAECYDWVFLDCPPGLGLLTRNALIASDTCVVPTVPHFLAVEGLHNLLLAIQRLVFRCDRRVRLGGILATMVDYRTRVARHNVDALRQAFGADVFAVEVRINTKLAEAPAEGLTILEHAPSSTGAGCYRLLAEELQVRLGHPSVETSTLPAETGPDAHPVAAAEGRVVEDGSQPRLVEMPRRDASVM